MMMMNPKPAVLNSIAFDWERISVSAKSTFFQNLQ